MMQQKPPGDRFPYLVNPAQGPEFWPYRGDTGAVAGSQAGQALYVSDDWEEYVRGSLTAQGSRAEVAGALRAVAFVAQTMAESLEENGGGYTQPPTNYGVQR